MNIEHVERREAPEQASFLEDAIAGLSLPQKRLPCKYFYDERGSSLFDEICDLDEYYLTRTELSIMRAHAANMAARLGRGCLLIEYGSGSSIKTRLLLDHLDRPSGYAPVDVSREHLLAASARIASAYPHVQVYPVCADFTQPFELPVVGVSRARRAVYFPGSTIGNFTPGEARRLLAQIARVVGAAGAIVGIDLQKSPRVLEAAYNDARGVTADFNMNLLARINRELGGNFSLSHFEHRAIYDANAGRIEMHLVSLRDQDVTLGGRSFSFREGETILTEFSHKYTLDGFAALAAPAGLIPSHTWTDEEKRFAVVHLVPRVAAES